jgi:BirA family biotin operon repressor/biotin-[acetyl-CoA-carboxylase] ligase
MAAQGRTPPVGVLLSALIAALDRTVDLWLRSGFPEIRRRWMNHAHGLGAEIVASTGVSGVFAGLDDSGAIIIASAAGERHRLVSGSVRYISTD